jgi:septal ring factor EnvC (AmiA/AmiB activator)
VSTEDRSQRKPTKWIVLCGLLGVAVVCLAVWAFSAQSDADDAQAKLDAQEQAATAAVDSEAQQQFEQLATELGAAGDSLDEIEQELEQASATVDEAEQARADASGAIETAQAEAQAFQARFELTQTCLRGTLEAIGSAYEGGGLDAATQELQKLAGSCESAGSS